MRPFRIVTHRNWLAEQFASFGAMQDFGFDIDPSTAGETLWWAPGAWVASAAKTGVELPLMSCGPYWLCNVSHLWKGRRVANLTWPHIDSWSVTEDVFVKLPEAKVDYFPAQLHKGLHLGETLKQYHLPEGTLVQVQAPMNFRTEGRFFIAHGGVVASSLYRHEDWIWGADDPPIAPLERIKMRKMERFVNEFLSSSEKYAPGFVLDIGITDSGSPKVIEANAAWSSSPYDCNPTGVVQAIEAAHDFNGQYPQWAWQPNPVFDTAGPLRIVAR